MDTPAFSYTGRTETTEADFAFIQSRYFDELQLRNSWK